nr:ABC transporter ATP-binding protein [Oricola nitratireducens]
MQVSAVTPLLKCRGVTKRFGALAAVDGVDLDVSPGETIGIGGPNGAGKTTLFDVISGLQAPTAGTVELSGHSLAGLSADRILHRGMARSFQLNSGFDGLSVFDNVLAAVAFGRQSTSGFFLSSRKDRERAWSTLERLKLQDFANDIVENVPVLVRKKLMIATALVNEPQILLLDEPVGGLTPSETDEFIDLIDGLKTGGLTMIFVEHVMRFLTALADRALIMHQGRIIFDGPPSQIGNDPIVRSVYLGSAVIEPAASGGGAHP